MSEPKTREEAEDNYVKATMDLMDAATNLATQLHDLYSWDQAHLLLLRIGDSVMLDDVKCAWEMKYGVTLT